MFEPRMARPRGWVTLLAFSLTVGAGACHKKKEAAKASPKRHEVAARPAAAVPAPAKTPTKTAAKPPLPRKAPAKATAPGLPPEKVPHPDYPTPRLAKTDKIFLLEEPERGPKTRVATLPDEKTLRFSFHRHCELAHDTLVCGPKTTANKLQLFWRVGRRQRRLAFAERRYGPRVMSRYVFERGGAELQRIVSIDAYGGTRWARHFEAGGKRYSERRLTGANRLPGCGRLLLAHDATGRVERSTCLQWGGVPMLDARGVLQTRVKRNAKGFAIELVYLDAQGKPAAAHDGVHRQVWTRDGEGRRISQRAFDLQGFPVLSQRLEGCHGLGLSFDRRGLEVRRSCLGTSGKAALARDGTCRNDFRYDGRGCHIGTQSYVLDGDACTRRRVAYRYTVDAHCGRLTKVCLTATGQRRSCGVKEAAELRYQRDEKGRVISTKHFAEDGRPGRDVDCGRFEERRSYDAVGNVEAKSYHGVAGEPLQCGRTGFHGLRSSYDAAGRMTERRFIGTDGRPSSNLGTIARKQRYDNYDHLAVSTNYGADGKLISALGTAINRRIYDSGHRLFGILLFDAQQKPARYRGCYTGRTCPDVPWHAMRVVREANGSVMRNLFFDHDGQLIRTVLCDRARCWK